MRLSPKALLLGLSLTGPNLALADNGPVLVELFTSQGCSSCPPADALLERLATRDDVLPLAFHVDYWDYLGWTDEFASPVLTARQHHYANAIGERMVYTPQSIVQGHARIAGTLPMELSDAIAAEKARPNSIDLSITRQGPKVALHAEARDGLASLQTIVLVQYLPEAEIDITRGENAGRRLRYVNIVRHITELPQVWDPSGPLEIELDLTSPEALKTAILFQDQGFGPVRATARLD